MGAGPDDLPGYQKVADPEVLRRFERAWGASLPREPGGSRPPNASPPCWRGACAGCSCSARTRCAPTRTRGTCCGRSRALDFLVVQDLFLTETAKLADVVLPGRSYAEKEGTFTNTERRVQRVRKARGRACGRVVDTDIFTRS